MEFSAASSSTKSDDLQNTNENMNHITCKIINCQKSDEINSSNKSQLERIRDDNITKSYEHSLLIYRMSDALSSTEEFVFSVKMIALKELFINKKRIIILSKNKLVLDIIKNYWDDKKYECFILDDSIRGEKRQETINTFNSTDSNVCILLIEFKNIFKGINLSCADTIIFYDNEIDEKQEAEIIQNFNIKNNASFYHLIISSDNKIDKYKIHFSVPKKITEKVEMTNSDSVNSEQVTNNNSKDQDLNQLKFPLQIDSNFTILTIGTIVQEKGFHTEKYIYPLGYTAKRFETVWYLLKINEDIHHKPIFRIEMENDKSVFFEDSEPTKACIKFYKSLGKNILLTGPEFFGLSFSVVQHIIQNLDGVNELKNYKRNEIVINIPTKACLKFQNGGACNCAEHYMVNIDNRLKAIKEEFIDKKEYFVINRSRQTGKTTTLFALAEYLKSEYLTFFVDLQQIDQSFFLSDEVFINKFICHFIQSYKIFNDNPDEELIKPIQQLLNKGKVVFSEFLEKINSICQTSTKPLILIIDEIDAFKVNPIIFINFLSLLRGQYQLRHKVPSFHSVILSGVRKIQHFRDLISDKDKCSPWNIGKAFTIEMSFSVSDIASMLEEYESVNHTEMQIHDVSEYIYEYTSGQPFYVSAICKTIDEELSDSSDFKKWSRKGVKKSVDLILSNGNNYQNDIISKLKENPRLKEMLKAHIIKGQSFSSEDAYEDSIDQGKIFGIIKVENGNMTIANRIIQMLLSYNFISEEKMKLLNEDEII